MPPSPAARQHASVWSGLSHSQVSFACLAFLVITAFTRCVSGPRKPQKAQAARRRAPSTSYLAPTMRGSERWSLLDGDLVRRRRAARAVINHYLDRLVDIFDFPLAPPSHSIGSLPASSSADAYMTMDGTISPRSRSRECTIGSFRGPRKVSMAGRVRELLRRSGPSKTRNSIANCGGSTERNGISETRVSWLKEKSKAAPKEPQDDLWFEREEQDRQLECGYQCLADSATI
jgi:hypothetical protein